MKSFILSDGTEVKMINSTGTLEHIMGNKRVKLIIDNKMFYIYRQDIYKLKKCFEEV